MSSFAVSAIVAPIISTILLPFLVVAQNFTVPSTWQNTSGYYTQTERIQLAQAAIDQYLAHGGGEDDMILATQTQDLRTVESMLQMISAIARMDAVINSSHNVWIVDEQLRFLMQNDAWYLAIGSASNMTNETTVYTPDRTMYAMACLDAYVAYSGEDLLTKAQILWEDIASDLITPADIASGTHNNTRFVTECNGASLLGGLWPFHTRPYDGDLVMTSQDTAKFLTITAILAELDPSNRTLTEYAGYAVSFYEQDLVRFSPLEGCLQQQILLNYAPLCGTNAGGGATFIDCSTWSAGGLAILANVTNNLTLLHIAVQQMTAFMHSSGFPEDGILTEDTTFGITQGSQTGPGQLLSTKYDFMASIPTVWKYAANIEQSAGWNGPSFASLLEPFVNVQINAIMTYATSGNSSLYGVDWTGPPPTDGTISIAGMSAAITALAASIGPYSPSPSVIPNQVSSSSSSLRRKLSGSALAGIICASVIAALLVVGAFTIRSRRHYRRRATDAFARRLRLQNGQTRTALSDAVSRRNSISKDHIAYELDEVRSSTVETSRS